MKFNSYVRLPLEVNRILYIRNLPFNFSKEEYYEFFGKFGAIRQIRKGLSTKSKGTAYVVFEDIYDAKNCFDSLNGYQLKGRFLIIVYFNPNKPLGKGLKIEK